MSDCLNCNEIDLTTLGAPGAQGDEGPAGADGADGNDGIAIVAYTDADSHAALETWATVSTLSVPANTLAAQGDTLHLQIVADGGDNSANPLKYDAIRILINANPVVVNDVSYPVISPNAETYHFPYVDAAEGMIIEMWFTYRAVSSGQLYTRMISNNGTRVDFLNAGAVFDITANNTIYIQTWNGTVANSVNIASAKLTKELV